MFARLFANPVSGYMATGGIGALVAAMLLARRAMRLAQGDQADGLVVGYVTRMRERPTGAIQYMPVLRFVAGTHGEREVQSRVGSIHAGRLTVGSRVRIRYDPEDPDIAEIDSVFRRWAGAIGMLVLGGLTLLGAWKAGSQSAF